MATEIGENPESAELPLVDWAEEYVVPVEVAIPVDGGAPLPVVLKDEWQTYILFRLLPSDDETHKTGILEIQHCWGLLEPGFDEESIWLHRLWDSGLESVGFIGEVINSQWVKMFERPPGSTWPFGGNDGTLHHYVLQFHDSIIEFVSTGFRYTSDARSIRELIPIYAVRLLESEK